MDKKMFASDTISVFTAVAEKSFGLERTESLCINPKTFHKLFFEKVLENG